MNWFFFFFANYFLFVSYLIVSIFGMICCYIQNKYVHWIYFRQKTLWGMFPICFCVSWFWWQLNTKKQVLENVCWMSYTLISPSASSSNNWTRMRTRGVHILVQGTELLSKNVHFLSHVQLWFQCLFYAFILVCTQTPNFLGLW